MQSVSVGHILSVGAQSRRSDEDVWTWSHFEKNWSFLDSDKAERVFKALIHTDGSTGHSPGGVSSESSLIVSPSALLLL